MRFLRRRVRARAPAPADTADLLDLYRAMARARAFELLLLELWQEGRISGELHLGTGEEAIAAGIAAHLRDGDAVALDHRSTPLLLLRGVDPVAIVRELLGRPDGLCGGMGGHMHLFSPEHLAASSGIVGASAPTAAVFALAAKRLRPGAIAVATFGDGAMNQGMLLETLNLAVVWRLPLLLVCKDNGWAITTSAAQASGGDLLARARAFGLDAVDVDGLDVAAVHAAAGDAIARLRAGGAPVFLHARCTRLDGHMADFLLNRVAASPLGEGRETMRQVTTAALGRGGAPLPERARSVATIGASLMHARGERRDSPGDPLRLARQRLASRAAELADVAAEVDHEMAGIRAAALGQEEAR